MASNQRAIHIDMKVQRSNTTKSGFQLRPSRRSRREKKAEINNSCTRAAEEYSQASKIAKKSIQTDNGESMNILAAETEEAAHQGNLQELWTTIKQLSRKFEKPERPVNDKGGKPPILDEDGQKNRWIEHFE